MKKKMCFVTAARSEYGLLKWLMKDLEASDKFKLQLIVTGAHLSNEQGHTIDLILADGFEISHIVDVNLDTSSKAGIARSMGRMGEGFASAFEELKPDYLIVLGDRYELLPICNTAFVMGIPIIHISGGDVTLGAIDDGIRNAVTMLAQYHFPGTTHSGDNIIRMRGNNENVWVVGEPGLDAFNREDLLERDELASQLGLLSDKKWALMTYHANTTQGLEYNLECVKNCIDAVCMLEDFQTVITYANADFGGKQINEYIEKCGMNNPEKIRVIPSLGQHRYLSYMRQVEFIIGNSSSGIVEAPYLKVPVVNIGNRQTGRHQCSNIIQCDSINREDICEAIRRSMNYSEATVSEDSNYWGDGCTSKRIIEILEREII